MPLLDAMTSAAGEELTLYAGRRSTRLTALASPAARVASGVLTASSAGGTIVTLASGTFGAAVAGQIFRVMSGPRVTFERTILSVDSITQITLSSSLGGAITSVSWEIESLASTVLNVEGVLGWEAAGVVYVDGQRYTYSARTDTQLQGIQRDDPRRPFGRIVCIAGSALLDSDWFTIGDGAGHTVTFEFDSDGRVTTDRRGLAYTALDSVTTVAATLIRGIEQADLQIYAVQTAPGIVDLLHYDEGTTGNIAMVDNVANAGFSALGLQGGRLVATGVAREHAPRAEVIAVATTYSTLDRTRAALTVTRATGADLDVLGRRVGVPRPSGLTDDELYRTLIGLLGYSPRGTYDVLSRVFDAILGSTGWESMVSEVGSTTLRTGRTPLFPTAAVREPCTIFVRSTTETTTDPLGKTILNGGLRRPMASTTTVDLGQPPLNVSHLGLARDSSFGLVAAGVDAVGTATGVTITAPAASFSAVQIGDVFEILSGPLAGRRGTIRAIPTNATLTIGAVEGASHYTIGTNFNAVRWRVVRDGCSFRFARPSLFSTIEYDGDPGTETWVCEEGGAASEAIDAVITNNVGNGGRYLQLALSNAGDTIAYAHAFRCLRDSSFTVEFQARCRGLPLSDVTSGLQWCLQVHDGARAIVVGLINSGVVAQHGIGFVDTSTGEFISGPAFTTANDTAFHTLRIEKIGNEGRAAQPAVRLYINNVLVQTTAYDDFNSTTEFVIRFGVLDTTSSDLAMEAKWISWFAHSPRELANTRVVEGAAGSLAAATRRLTDDGALGLFAVGDTARAVRIFDWTAVNAAGGNPRGVWDIDTRVSADVVSLVGPTRRNLRSTGSGTPRRLVVETDPAAFTWPDNLGHQLVIEAGPNAGTYTIARLLDPGTLQDLNARYPGAAATLSTWTSADAVNITVRTNIVELTADLPDPAADDSTAWHLSPVFANDAGPVPYEIVDTTAVAGDVVTLRTAVPISGTAAVLETHFTDVLSAQVQSTSLRNTETSPGVWRAWSMYLYDGWGWIRAFATGALVKAGYRLDLDRLTRDDSGLHIK